MLIRNHVKCTVCTDIAMLAFHEGCRIKSIPFFKYLPDDIIHRIIHCDSLFWKHLGIHGTHFVPAAIAFVLFSAFGSMCPDYDHKCAFLKKRTWLHAVYIPLLCFYGGIFVSPLSWFGMGWLFHLIADAPSTCGDAFLYPITGYRKYPNGGVIKRGHKIKLYATGSGIFKDVKKGKALMTERTFVFLVMTLLLLSSVYCLYGSFLIQILMQYMKIN